LKKRQAQQDFLLPRTEQEKTAFFFLFTLTQVALK
jgi:hypothetical protein